MMRSREDGKRQPCVHCGTLTVFERWFHGPRGAQRHEPCCTSCGPVKDGERFAGFGSDAA